MEAWFGAMLAGAIPVALAPLGAMSAAEAMIQKITGVVERIGARYLICDASLCEQIKNSNAGELAKITLAPPTFFETKTEAISPVNPESESTAFLQLTSGSTGLPRAVMIPHRAALHNPAAIADAIGEPFGEPDVTTSESVVSWLPLNHDMGLVGCLVFSIYNGLNLKLMRPDTFLLRPATWLRAFGDSGVSLAPAPNFAYQTCVERLRPKDIEALNLSGWRAAMTGAEMIRPDTCEAFNQTFAPCGLSPKTFRPCFGLAEGTLAVTFDRKGEGYRTRPAPTGADAGFGLERLVSTGPPIMDSEVSITAPDGRELPDGEIGEVRAKGPSIFSGYYNDPEATREGLQDGWLCTGDLGFMHEGELYLTGRSKEVLILHGHNIMPHEIEWVAESVTGGGGVERCGAFSISKGAEGEVAVLVVETAERDTEKMRALAREVKTRIGQTMGLPLADLVLVRRGQIPKTTSGKVQRGQLRDRYLKGQIESLA